MAHALQIDTLAFSKKLKNAGADARLADAIVEGLTAADTSELATKSDILIVENKIDKVESKIDKVESALKADNAEVKGELKADISNVEKKIDKVENKIVEVKAELKQDIAQVKVEIAEVKGELKADIAEVKSELTTLIMQSSNRTIYIIGGLIGLLFTIDKLLPLAGIK